MAWPRFQSSPGLVTGRYLRTSAVRPPACRFQSSPGLVTGRYVLSPEIAGIYAGVSILARSGDRALLTRQQRRDGMAAVSILARSGDRALPPNISSQTTGLPVSILARSGDRALRS